jgi:hypothetical protein
VAEDVVDDLLKKMFDRPESNDMPDMTDGEGDEDEDEELGDGAPTDVGEDENATNNLVKNVIADMFESLFKEVNTKDMSELSDVDDEDEDVEVARGLCTDTDDECKLSDDEDNDRDEVVPGLLIGTGDESELSDVEDNDESEGPLRMKGGSEVFLTEDFDNYDRQELIEYLLALNVKTDLTRDKTRLFDALLQVRVAQEVHLQCGLPAVFLFPRQIEPFQNMYNGARCLLNNEIGNLFLLQHIKQSCLVSGQVGLNIQCQQVFNQFLTVIIVEIFCQKNFTASLHPQWTFTFIIVLNI